MVLAIKPCMCLAVTWYGVFSSVNRVSGHTIVNMCELYAYTETLRGYRHPSKSVKTIVLDIAVSLRVSGLIGIHQLIFANPICRRLTATPPRPGASTAIF